MKNAALAVLLSALLSLLIACPGEPAGPTPDLDATVDARVQATRAAAPPTDLPAATPDLDATVTALVQATRAAFPTPTARPSPCVNGIVITEPESNPGLVQDCAALLKARDVLDADALLNWSNDIPIEKWDGVTLSNNFGRVQGLALREKELIGRLSPELGQLARLESLDLEYNLLRGEIPSELGHLTSLKALLLGGNRLTGGLPTELGQLSNLERLSLQDNQLTDAIPPALGRLANLETLNLSGNPFTGCVPAELQQISNVTYPDLRQCPVWAAAHYGGDDVAPDV